MNHLTIRLHPITSLLLTLMLLSSSLAASPRPASIPVLAYSTPATGMTALSRSSAPASVPEFPNCPNPPPPPPTCSNLQVFLLIDDSGSMLFSDPTRQRLAGAKNVLDILVKEYYLPAVDANAKDPNIQLPNIQVSLIHFSSVVLYNSGWKTINPGSIDEWNTQIKTFDADLAVPISTVSPHTDFRTVFDAAVELAKPQTADCPRLLMLFTDGVPNLGDGNLYGETLTQHMNVVQGIIESTFNRSNDVLFVSAFGSGKAFREFWGRDHKGKWKKIAKDSDDLDPPRVEYVPTQELASRMERIVGSTTGNQVYTLTPVADNPQQYITEIPLTVDSLRLTYYTINTATRFTVRGPDGKMIQLDGKNVILTGANSSIQVLEILNPAPGSYQIATTAAGGLLTQLLRFEKIAAKLTSPSNNLLQFTNGQIGIQLLGADGKPLAISPQMSIEAALTPPEDKPNYLTLTSGSDTFTTDWMPLTASETTVYACATLTLKDNQGKKGKTLILYHGEVGKITIDKVSVQVGDAGKACVPTEKDVSVPLQLINDHSQQPAAIAVPVKWDSNLGTIGETDAKSGKYALRFKPTSAGDMQFAVNASAIADGADSSFYEENISIRVEPPRHLKLTLEKPETVGDRLSVFLYRAFHPSCINDNTEMVIGRRFFGLFGSTSVQINGRFSDVSNNVGEPGIERFAVQLVSHDKTPSSEMLSSWTIPETEDDFSTLEFRSPGLGLYDIAVTNQGKNLECTELDSLPTTRAVLLINDFWEYLIILILILILLLLVFYLLRRYRNRRYGHEIPLILLSIVLITLNVILVNQVVNHTFQCQFNCGYLIDRTLNTDTLCSKGVPFQSGSYNINYPFTDIYWFTLGPFPETPFSIMPALNVIDPPLEALRKFISWAIIVFLALGSLGIAFLASKLKGFIARLRTPESRTAILSNIGIWLFFFVIFCSLFYFRVVP